MNLNQMKEIIKAAPARQKIAGLYVFIVLAVFPLYYKDYYYDILDVKYKFYCVCAILLIVAAVLYGCFLFTKKNETWQELGRKFKTFDMPDLCMLAFLGINIISTLQSDYVYESFWGNEGRFSGLFLWLLYGGAYFAVTRFFHLKRWYLDAFLIAGLLVCLFGITDYFQLDILKFKVGMNPAQLDMFTSTIGNVNSYTAYVALYMGVSAVLYGTAKTWPRVIWYYVCLTVSFFAIIMGLSDNSYLALGTLFAFLPLYLFRTRTGVRRYAVMLTTFSITILSVDYINRAFHDQVLQMGGLLRALSNYDKLEYVVLGLICLSLVTYALNFVGRDIDYDNSREQVGRWLIVGWQALLILGAAVIIYVLYDANVAGQADRYGKLSNYLIFNDDWGTHRGYIWRIAVEKYREFPLLHKLFGYGQDTFGIITLRDPELGTEMVRRYNEIFESVHNEYLQFFVTVGPFGALAYVSFLAASFVAIVKKTLSNECAMATLFACLCYAVQAVVNISVPIVTPIIMTLLMVGLSVGKAVTKAGEPEIAAAGSEAKTRELEFDE